MTRKRYLVTWIEYHEIEVEGHSDDDAVDEAYNEDPEKTRKTNHIQRLEVLGGYCREHGLDYDGVNCPRCAGDDARCDEARGK